MIRRIVRIYTKDEVPEPDRAILCFEKPSQIRIQHKIVEGHVHPKPVLYDAKRRGFFWHYMQVFPDFWCYCSDLQYEEDLDNGEV
jgi:hypothetical protein